MYDIMTRSKVLKGSNIFCTRFFEKGTGLKVIKKIIGCVDIFAAKGVYTKENGVLRRVLE